MEGHTTDPRELTKLRKRRGVVHASITRLESRLRELEEISDQPTTADHAHQLAVRSKALDSEFKSYHLQLVDLIDENDDELLEKEQEILDKHDDHVADMNVRFNRLYSNATPTAPGDRQKLSSRKLAHLERSVISVRDAIIALPTDHEDISLLEQYQAQLSDYKMEMAVIHTELLSVDDEDEVSDQLVLYSKLEGILFECSHCARKLLRAQHHLESATTISTDHGSGVKLPKLDVPTFDGSILQWRRFCVSVHSRSNLTDAEKLVYLQHALKDGSAKTIIEGLSQSGEQYPEAVKCLTAQFDRPRLIHQTHVKMILDAPQLRDGSGKELRRLHDIILQHLRALKSMDQQPSPSFITSIIELKLDTTTMFEWQRHTQSQNEVPHYRDILEFIDHRAQASEISTPSRKPLNPILLPGRHLLLQNPFLPSSLMLIPLVTSVHCVKRKSIPCIHVQSSNLYLMTKGSPLSR